MQGAPVHDLRFEGLTFAHTEWQPPADYASSLQAGIEVPGAVLFDYAERCAVTGGAIEHIGNYGVEVGVGCSDIEISRNRITDIGAGAVRIGHFFSWETDGSGRLTERGIRRKAAMPKGPHSRRITVADNEIAHLGRFTPEAVGVFVGDNAECQDRPQPHPRPVLLGHLRGLGPGLRAVRGDRQRRRVQPRPRRRPGDAQRPRRDLHLQHPESRVAYNVVHDVTRRDYGGWGIYPDEGTHDLLIRQNLVYRCQDGALFAHHNRDVTAENNIFALNPRRPDRAGRHRRVRADLPAEPLLLHRGEGRRGLRRRAHGRDVCAFDRNLYWNASGKPVLFGAKSFAEWQATGQDKGSRVADPLFVAPDKGDFRLRPGSPAAEVGFEPWDLSTVGPRPAAAKRE